MNDLGTNSVDSVDYPDFAQFLVEEGIDSISVTPDSFFKTVMAIRKVEDEIEAAKRLCLSA